jgi:hypothetical protein
MRYIPDTGKQFVLQVPEDKNSYINVKNYDARGLSTVFTGSIFSGLEDQLSIGSISDGEGKTLQQYLDVLSVGIELQAHIYRGVGSGGGDLPIISVSNVNLQGVNFSSSNVTSNLIQPLKYYIFGYDTSTGKMPNAVQIVGAEGQYSKVLDPNNWNQDQYVDINFTKTGQYVVPIIYRVWGTRVEFLGMIGNAKIGFPGASVLTFRDYGLKEIPSWNNDPDYWTPDFLDSVISILGGVPTQLKKIVGREHLKIMPRIEGSQPNYIQCKAVPDGSLINPEDYQFGDEVKFVIDDTQPIRNAINLAAQGNIKEIFFPAGTYHFRNSSFINTASTDYSNISFRGIGEGSIIKRLRSSISGSINPGLINFSGQGSSASVEGIRFRSLVFDGNRSSTASLIGPIAGSIDPSRYIAETLIFLKYANNISVTECRFIDAGGAGVHTEFCSAILLTNSIFSRLGRSYEPEVRPIEVYETSNSIVQGNIFEFCTSGPYFFSVDFSTINNNIIRSCGDQGVVLETSYQWNAANNLAYSDTDSLIRSVDQYNNEYSKAPIEIRRGTALEPIYFTVTNGGETIGIKKDTIIADIYGLDALGRKNASNKIGSFKVIQTADQLEAGIFSVTLPGLQSATIDGNTVPSTSSFSLLDPGSNQFGYMYEISGTVRLGSSGRGYVPVNIRNANIGGTNYLAIQLRNSSELLSFLIFDADSAENDYIIIEGFSNTDLDGWDQNSAYRVVGVDINSNSLLIDPIPSLSPGTTGVDFLGGQLYIQRSNYQIADGNIIVN